MTRPASIRDLDLSALRPKGALPANIEVGFFGRPVLPIGVRYALLWSRLGRREDARPFAYATPADLAKAIHRRRDGAPLQLLDCPILVAPRRTPDEPLHGVSVWTQDRFTGAQDRFLGWAYLDGHGRHGLTSALRWNPLGSA